jgi:hypothetical protein
MLPWAGGFRELMIAGEGFASSPTVRVDFAYAYGGRAAKILTAADLWRSSLLFMAVLLFEKNAFQTAYRKTTRVENSVALGLGLAAERKSLRPEKLA